MTAAFQIGNMACHSVAEVWPGFYCGRVEGQWSVNLALNLLRLTGIEVGEASPEGAVTPVGLRIMQ